MYVRVAARYFYWPRLSEGLPGRGKKKGKKKKKKKKMRNRREKSGASSESIHVIFFRPDFTGDEQISPRGVSAAPVGIFSPCFFFRQSL